MSSMLDTGAVLIDAATSPDRADEALSTLAPLIPGLHYFRWGGCGRGATGPLLAWGLGRIQELL